MRSRGTLVLVVVGLALAASSAQADEIRVRPGRRGLQRALDRAKPGDTIVLRGAVRDDVTVTVPGVTIEAGGRGRFSGNVNIAADGVTISRAKFRKSAVVASGHDFAIVDSELVATPVHIEGDGASIVRNEIEPGLLLGEAVTIVGDGATVADNDLSLLDRGVRIAGDDAVVGGNTFEDGTSAIVVVGNDASVEGNVTMTPAEIVVAGDGATVSNNVLAGPVSVKGNDADVHDNDIVAGGPALTVSGDSAVVEDNSLASGEGGAIVDGNDATISDNVVTVPYFGDGGGIVAVGDGAVISGNEVTVDRVWSDERLGMPFELPQEVRFDLVSVENDGIAAFGDGNLVEDNDVSGSFAGGAAVRVQGDGNDVDANVVQDAQQVYSIVLIGDDNSADENEVSDVQGEGVIVQGEDGVVSDTDVSGISSCGFLLIGDTRLQDCTATACGMGVVNLAGDSALVGTTVSGNAPYDLVDLGNASVAGGSVGWIATDAASFPDFVSLFAGGFVPAATPRLGLAMPNTFGW